MEIPDQLDPFDALHISSNASPQEVKAAFRHKICSPKRQQRAMVALAYDMICSKDSRKYTRQNGMVYVQRKDLFYYVLTGNYHRFADKIRGQKSSLNERDEHERTLLYIAARNGFHDICHFLLRSGCNTNQIQVYGSTALHAAAFYGHLSIVELLLEYGANAGIQNKFTHTAQDEARTDEIRNCIRTKAVDQIYTLLNAFKSQASAKSMVLIKHFDRIIAKKILGNPDYFSGHSLQYLVDHWPLAWHGTKYRHLQSIMQLGLHPAGTSITRVSNKYTRRSYCFEQKSGLH